MTNPSSHKESAAEQEIYLQCSQGNLNFILAKRNTPTMDRSILHLHGIHRALQKVRERDQSCYFGCLSIPHLPENPVPAAARSFKMDWLMLLNLHPRNEALTGKTWFFPLMSLPCAKWTALMSHHLQRTEILCRAATNSPSPMPVCSTDLGVIKPSFHASAHLI